jgi:hypothetical protein
MASTSAQPCSTTPASAYSRDGGRSWTKPDALRYRPGGRIVKQPRACAKLWQTRNGRYLLWFHNNGTINCWDCFPETLRGQFKGTDDLATERSRPFAARALR